MCGCESRYALLMTLYDATNGPGWTNAAGWTLHPASCSTEWYGVTCSGTDITSVQLNSNRLSGTLPAEWGNMSAITTLSLYLNSLTGTLPAAWANMKTVVYLYIYSNRLNGTLPAAWVNMTSFGGH
jgi:hypothetical protein